MDSLRALLLPVVLLLSWGSAWAQVTAIRAGRLVNPEAGTALDNQVILVEGSRIKAVGPGLAIPEGATVIDLTGATVLPGLFDAHTHLCATLDRPTWVLLKHEADWRWMQDRTDSPWYPSMRLFRQARPGDWASPITAAAQALSALGSPA